MFLMILGISVGLAFLLGAVFFFIGFVGSIKKCLTVYYDASDAVISLLTFFIVNRLTGFILAPLYSSNGAYRENIYNILTLKEPVNTAMLWLMVAVVVNIVFIGYSFYMSYIYNRRRKGFIIAAFMGRCVGPYFLTSVVSFLIIFVLGRATSYIDLLLAGGNIANIGMSLIPIVLVLLFTPAFIRRFEFSDFSNYFNLHHLHLLSAKLEDEYTKAGYRSPKARAWKRWIAK